MTDRTARYKWMGLAVSILTPLVLLMLSIRVLITPLFPQIEYRLPGFPDDPYGFSLEDRLKWSAPSIRYLVNFEDVAYLGNLQFEDGEPLFNDRELSHMVDVKAVVSGMRIALIVAILGIAVLGYIMIRADAGDQFRTAVYRGSWALIGIIVGILILLAINFNQLFTWFHQLFFMSGTWVFYTSDTLIRLFPMRFWQDAFIFVGGFSLLLGLILLILTRPRPA